MIETGLDLQHEQELSHVELQPDSTGTKLTYKDYSIFADPGASEEEIRQKKIEVIEKARIWREQHPELLDLPYRMGVLEVGDGSDSVALIYDGVTEFFTTEEASQKETIKGVIDQAVRNHVSRKQYERLEVANIHPKLKGMIESIDSLIGNKEFADKLANNEYSCLIGVDGGGRLPALLMHKLMRRLHGEEGPKIIFLSGSGQPYMQEFMLDHPETVKLKIEGIKKILGIVANLEKKVLIIEDVVKTASSLRDIAQALREQGMEFDIMTLSAMSSIESIKETTGASGVYPGAGRGYLGNKLFSGVSKNASKVFSDAKPNTNSAAIRESLPEAGEELYNRFNERQQE